MRDRKELRRTQEPRRVTPGLFALSHWNNEVATKYDGETVDEQVCRKTGRSGLDVASLEFREQALSWREQLEHHEMAGIQVLR